MLKQPTSPPVSRQRALVSAKQYVIDQLGPQFDVLSVEDLPDSWWARVYVQSTNAQPPLLVGHLRVSQETGVVVPLSSAGLSDMAARAVVLAAQRRADLARDDAGHILPYQARLKAAGYMASEIVFYAVALDAPAWIAGEPPYWRVPIALQLPMHGKVCDLGTVDVNAVTGEVIPLSPTEIQTRQKRANDAAQAVEHSAAT